MNAPTLLALDAMLKALGSESPQLGSASIGLVRAAFVQSPTITLAALTEANYTGYKRQAIGNPSIPFTGGDGNEYVEGTTVQFMPSDTVTPNTVYGMFLTFGNDSTKIWATDVFNPPLPLNGPANQITITPRIGLNPLGNFGANVVSN